MEDIISNLEREELIRKLPLEIRQEMRIVKYKPHEVVAFDASNSDYVWRVLSGAIKIKYFTLLDHEINGEFHSGEWFGGPCSLIGFEGSVDILTIKESVILWFPLKKMIEKYPEEMNAVWEVVAVESAKEYRKILSNIVAKLTLTNEGYFIKYLMDNNGLIEFNSLDELGEILNMNVRTLYRIIGNLKQKNLILKRKETFEVTNMKKLKLYYENTNHKDNL